MFVTKKIWKTETLGDAYCISTLAVILPRVSYLLRPCRPRRTVVPGVAQTGRFRGRLYGVVALRRDEAVFFEVVHSGVGVVGARRAGIWSRHSGRTVVARRASVAGEIFSRSSIVRGQEEGTARDESQQRG